jgi:hypothetical protein
MVNRFLSASHAPVSSRDIVRPTEEASQALCQIVTKRSDRDLPFI